MKAVFEAVCNDPAPTIFGTCVGGPLRHARMQLPGLLLPSHLFLLPARIPIDIQLFDVSARSLTGPGI